MLYKTILTVMMSLFMTTGITYASVTLRSTSITEGTHLTDQQVYNGYGCQGKNLSPQLSWDAVPPGTQSLAVTMFDPDARNGQGWWHWLVFDISSETRTIAEGASLSKMPSGSIESITDFGAPGYGGACPPAGDPEHHYIVTLWFLKVPKLNLEAKTKPQDVERKLQESVISKITLTGLYKRPR